MALATTTRFAWLSDGINGGFYELAGVGGGLMSNRQAMIEKAKRFVLQKHYALTPQYQEWIAGIMADFTLDEMMRDQKQIPVLCEFWEEDGVFNGVATQLPVAVFGKTHEEAVSNLTDAIIAHLEARQGVEK